MSEMTGKQRLLAAMRGGSVDRVPFALNAWQWFYAHQFHGQLPPEFAHCRTAIEFHKAIGADILTRWDGQIKGRAGLGAHVRFPRCRFTREEFGEPIDRPVRTAFNDYRRLGGVRSTIETPHGTLSQAWRFEPQTCADFEEEFWIKDISRDLPALRFVVADRSYDFEMEDYERDLAAIGDAGVIAIEIPESPIKMLHWFMGPETAMLALFTHPAQLKEIFAIHTARTLAFVDGVCARTRFEDAPLLMSNDNLDARLVPPDWFKEFLYDHYRPVAERAHAHGRLFAVHSCGNNWELRHGIRETGIDMMEGLTPPPPGNFPLELARPEIGEHFIVEGGMHCKLQELADGAEAAIDAWTRDLFAKMAGTPRFIYSSSCQTSSRAPVENIYRLRDACWKYGRR